MIYLKNCSHLGIEKGSLVHPHRVGRPFEAVHQRAHMFLLPQCQALGQKDAERVRVPARDHPESCNFLHTFPSDFYYIYSLR